MRITIFFPRLKTFSGAEHLLIQVARRFVERGHEVVVLTRAVSERCRSHLPDEVEVRTLGALSRLTGNHLLDSLLDVFCAPFLSYLYRGGTDVFCIVSDPALPAVWAARRRHPGVPVVYYCLQPPRFAYDLQAETVAANRPLGYLIPLIVVPYRRIDRWLTRRCDRVVALSRRYAAWCKELYGLDRVDLVPGGVDSELAVGADAARVLRRHGLDPDTPLVLTVNKLIARKNLDVFLRAMYRVVQEVPRAKGVVVGDGPLADSLRDLRRQLELEESVIFTGHLSTPMDVMDYYRASDVHVFLEKNVPFGLTILEAGICGAPSVAVGGGGVDDTLVDGRTGLLLEDHRDECSLARKIVWLLKHEEDRRRMGRGARGHAERYGWEACARGLLSVFEDVDRHLPGARVPGEAGAMRGVADS